MFHNSTERRLLLETWVFRGPGACSTHMIPVAKDNTVVLPESATDEWIVYLADTFTRIGKFRLHPAADGKRAWANDREYDVAYVAKNANRAAYHVARRRPAAGPPARVC